MAFLPRDTFKIDALDGGLNTKSTDITCPPNMSPYLLNIKFSESGAATIAEGCASFLTSLGTAQVDCLHSVYFSGTEYLVASQSALVSVATAAATAWSPVSGSTGVFTAGVDVCPRTVESQVFLTNGYAAAHRYDGTNFFTVGVSAYTGGVTATGTPNSSAGSMTSGGEYVYAISGENTAAVESNYAVITNTITVSDGGQVALSGIPNFPASAGVNQKYLYRNTATASGIYYRVTALTASQSTVTDTAADSALVTAGQTDNNPPPKCAFWWYHRGRMFGAGDPDNPYRVYYSSQGYPEIWPALNYQEIGKGDGQPITAIAIMGNSLVVHKADAGGNNQSIWLIYMPDSTDTTDATNWYILKSPSAYAAAGWKSIAFFENLMAFANQKGMYAFTGEDTARGPATSDIGQYAADALSTDVEDRFDNLTTTTAPKVSMVNDDNMLWISVPGVPGQGNAKHLTYDYLTASKQRGVGAWSQHLGAQNINAFTRFGGTVYAGGGTTGVVYRYGANYDINGNNALVTYYTPKVSGNKQHKDQYKVWRNVYLTISNNSHASMYYSFYSEDSSVYSATNTLASGTTRTYQTIKLPIVTDSGGPFVSRALQVYLSVYGEASFTTGTAPWQIHRIELEYLLRSRRT